MSREEEEEKEVGWNATTQQHFVVGSFVVVIAIENQDNSTNPMEKSDHDRSETSQAFRLLFVIFIL
jgi:hypothetical protein